MLTLEDLDKEELLALLNEMWPPISPEKMASARRRLRIARAQEAMNKASEECDAALGKPREFIAAIERHQAATQQFMAAMERKDDSLLSPSGLDK